jgi:hypothetical protein
MVVNNDLSNNLSNNSNDNTHTHVDISKHSNTADNTTSDNNTSSSRHNGSKTTTPSTTTSTPTITTSSATPSSTTTSNTTPSPSTTSSTSSTPAVYDTNDNNIYKFPLLHDSSGNMRNSFSNFFKNFDLTAGVLIIFLIVIVVFVILFSSLSSLGKNSSGDISSSTTTTNSNGSTSGGKSHIIIIIIIVAIVLVVSFIYRKYEETTIIASIKSLFTKKPQVNVTASKTPPLPMSQQSNKNPEVPEIKLYKEVFNIPGNNYTYSQAKSICSAYDATLATYDELEEAYGKGAEWCNYGWSEGQMALFPTQKKTYSTLQTIKGHEHDCGRPGINGGYMANPNVRYGVNCYGHKPKRTAIEKELMENTAPYPLTKEDMLMEKQVDYWKGQLPNIIVSPFNNNRWSKF